LKYPFLFLFIFLVSGILFSDAFSISTPIYIPLVLFLTALLFNNYLRIVLFGLSVFVLGVFINQKESLTDQIKNPVFIQCKVITFPKIYNSYEKFKCKVENSDNKNLIKKTVLVYNYEKNDEIQFFSDIYFIGNVKGSVIVPTEHFLKVDNSFNVFHPIFKLKSFLMSSYKENSLSLEAFSLGSALIFGEKGYISTSLREKFSRTGLSHLLAISGLHVGILVSSIFLFLFFLKDRIKHFIVLILLPFYTIFTGLQIPVLRASLMGELYFFSKIKYLKVNSLNILFFVAFIVLLFSPESIKHISFLLSFTATLGILLGLDFINVSIHFKNEYLSKVISIVIQIILLSFVATLFTVPIILYFFGSFSPITILATPIGILLLYPYIFLSVLNLLTLMHIPVLVKGMDLLGLIFINFVEFVNSFGLYFKGFNPSIISIFIFILMVSSLLLLKINFFKKLTLLILSLLIFLLISKTDSDKYKIYAFRSKTYPSVLIITPERESFLFSDYPSYKFKSVLNKENPTFNTLLTSNPKAYIFSSQLNIEFDRIYKFKNFFKNDIFLLKRKNDQILIFIKNHKIKIKNENRYIEFDG